MRKTIWQWLAVVCFGVGWLTLIGAWATIGSDTIWAACFLATMSLWAVSVFCVLFKPVGKGTEHNG